MNKRKIEPHEKFGKLEVLCEDGRIGRQLVAYKCVCECGKEIRCSSYDLLTRGKTSCGCQRGTTRADKYLGETFNELTILSIASYHRDTGKITRVLCLCSCGVEKIISLSKVVSGATKSCGHLVYVHTEEDRQSGINTIISRYKDKSQRRGLTLELSDADIGLIIKQDCYYCGLPPSQQAMHHGKLILQYNGIDRVNNDLGYTKENSVPCCHFCNRAKYTHSEEDFRVWLRYIKDTYEEI